MHSGKEKRDSFAWMYTHINDYANINKYSL